MTKTTVKAYQRDAAKALLALANTGIVDDDEAALRRIVDAATAGKGAECGDVATLEELAAIAGIPCGPLAPGEPPRDPFVMAQQSLALLALPYWHDRLPA